MWNERPLVVDGDLHLYGIGEWESGDIAKYQLILRRNDGREKARE